MIQRFIARWIARKAFIYLGAFLDTQSYGPATEEWDIIVKARDLTLKTHA